MMIKEMLFLIVIIQIYSHIIESKEWVCMQMSTGKW